MGISFDDMQGEIWMDGAFVDWADAKVHVLTHGLHYASSVFEGMRAYGGRVFKLREHNQRLVDSGRMLGFEVPWSVEELDEACNALLERSGMRDAYVRPVAWRGSEMMGVSAQGATIHTAIAVWEWPSYYDAEQRLKGIRLDMAEWRRPDPQTAPSHAKAAGLYMICTLAKHAAEAKGYSDALMLDYRGRVAEATSANVFFVRDGQLHTPDPDCFLNGLTRQTVIDLAERRQIKVNVRKIMPDELDGFEQCFLTGTAAEVTPVSEIGPHRFEVGEITRTLTEDYSAEARGGTSGGAGGASDGRSSSAVAAE